MFVIRGQLHIVIVKSVYCVLCNIRQTAEKTSELRIIFRIKGLQWKRSRIKEL